MGNASFNVEFEFVNAAQTKAEYRISGFESALTPYYGGYMEGANGIPDSTYLLNSYMAIYLAFSSLLNGNVSTTLTQHRNIEYTSFDGNVTVYEGSSKVLQHGLSVCEEFVNGYVSPSVPLTNIGPTVVLVTLAQKSNV